MKLIFAFALNDDGIFESKHFGDSDKFALFREDKDNIVFQEEVANTFKTIDEEQLHGSLKKGNAIISFLKEKNVDVLVSRQFGKNIKMVNKHFVPVVIQKDLPEEVLKILKKHKSWIKDELKNRKTDHMLFYIKNGVLKMHIKKD
ncbi:MAG: NifB/NifX family molybdenum-iron cluster-binding protein [Prolixibacteraceae bacterium]|nr:NifB/NifX family molybdenum-iron cluster-binding protein [Prolixibacteraceae bacterium]